MNKQPEALRLASVIDSWKPGVEAAAVAAELRRQHALIARLVQLLAFCIQPLEAQGMKNTATNVRAAISEAEAQQ